MTTASSSVSSPKETVARERAGSSGIRLDYLDVLRGFAALYVVIFHISLIPKSRPTVPGWMTGFVDFGGSGVTLFFIISGFSMCLTWPRHAQAQCPPCSFYLARFFRIAPLFCASLLFYLARDYWFKGEAGLHSPSEVVANALFVFNLHEPFQQGIVWASWTIGVEMLFYAVFPLIALIATTLKRSLLLLFTTFAAIVGVLSIDPIGAGDRYVVSTLLSGHGFVAHLPVFIIGIVVYHLHEEVARISVDARWRVPLATLLAGLAIVGLSLAATTTGRFWHYASAGFYGALLLAFSFLAGSLLVNRFTRHLGQISYSVYLNHPSLVFLLGPVYLLVYRWGMGTTASFLACILLTLAVLMPVSHLTFRFIEEPMMRLGKKLASRGLVAYRAKVGS